jgi:hypothetical protein
MKSLFAALAFAIAFAGTLPAVAASQGAPIAQSTAPPPADFGSPPSGEIPILYNDRHVYATPDLLKQGRVLAAYARNGGIYVPLRSMFEQMGATVSYDPSTKIATISKPGAEVVVTVGKPEVVVNGESRPLDVPPIVYRGVVLVPIRVISEGMGGYVQWVPDKRLVVVRYVEATPPPTEAPPPPAPEATVAPPPPPTPNPLTLGGFFRSYYFTRQNASNDPGTQFNFSPGAKYNSNGVNQASWNSAIALHGEYDFPNGWDIGGTYLYANPIDGPCVVPANHYKGAVCVSQTPPNTNADDTLPGFTLSTFYQAYAGYKAHGFDGQLGNVLFNSPWANPADSRLKPAAFQGAYLNYTTPSKWTFEGADMFTFENRTSSSFTQQTLLTSYPAGNNGQPSNIFLGNGQGINTNGFAMGKVGYGDATAPGFAADGYFYGVADLVNMWWFDGKYTFPGRWAPWLALQGGWDQNAGQSYVGKVNSQDFGAQIGFNFTKNWQFTAGYDQIPWKTDTVNLPSGVTCSNSNYQISAKATLGYFLPLNAAQCYTNPNGTTQIYYGGWASPYTDNYDSDPFFTTSVTQGQADRRAPGDSYKLGLQFTSTNNKWVFIGTDAWYNYGNALAPENTNIWTLDGRYRFSHYSGHGPYKGLVLRYRYIQRTLSNTFCGDPGTTCPTGSELGAPEFGGLPLFKYNRAQLEYDF